MRFVTGCSALLLLLPPANAAVAPAHAAHRSARAEPFRGGLEGDWEAVIESPRRPWAFVVHFVRSGDAWTGAMTFPGFPDFPLREVRAESTAVHFRFPPELDSIVFEGTLAGEAITGRVLEQGQPVPTRLTRSIALPAPRDRLEAWRQDLDFLTTHLGEYDRSFSPAARVDFLRAIGRLNLELPERNDDQILAALASAVALSGNAHTRMRLDPTRTGNFTTEFPLRMAWFADGCFVVKTAPELARALRARVVAIDGHELSQVRREVVRLFAANPAWADYLTPVYLTSPDLLHGLGLIRSRSEAVWTLQDAAGARFDLRIPATAIDRDAAPAESWQDLSPLTVTGRPPWVSAIAADPPRLPLYLRHPGKAYWFEYLREPGLLYFQFNRSGDDENGPTFEAFGDSLIGFARNEVIRGVVVDLRLNSGGNLEVAKDFFRNLSREDWARRPGRLFVIVGHCTFSAGLYHAAQLKQLSPATFVGEPVGDRLDFWAEGGEIVLPNSRAVICYSNGFHRYSQSDYPAFRPYYEELSIPALAPDVPAPLMSADYFAARDPALEAILSRLPK
jgi:hypothetical protein